MNKTILITGASTGLGKATAKLFAYKGWTVIATMRNPEKEIELTQYPTIHLLKLDINNPKQIAEIAAKAEKISPIDVLLNNAAYGLMGAFEGTTDEQLAQQINTNFFWDDSSFEGLSSLFESQKKWSDTNCNIINGKYSLSLRSGLCGNKIGFGNLDRRNEL